ncbi:transcriptional regulator [Zavarzinia compransoris]|uniref:Transcriptional regulator n=1 Tax=Zavarzinia compransoris TaxID=1264899 RepID=A0A317DUL5_9PROT|nr:transcriptional regulator [Zavarzinia compransoris]
MEEERAIEALSALAQATRMHVFRMLVARHPEGMLAGDIATALAVPHNTMSAHLAILTRAGLAKVQRQGRTMLYRADIDGFRGLIDFMTRECCGGRPDICAPLFGETVADCCGKA